MDLLRLLLHRLVYEYPCLVTEDEVNRYPKDFRKLVRLGLLTESQTASMRLCPTCKQEFLALRSDRNGCCFTVCTQNCGSGRDDVDSRKMVWTFDLHQLLREVQKAHGIQIDPHELIPGEVWLLEPAANSTSKTLFCRNLQPSHHSFLEKTKGCIVLLPVMENHLPPDHVQVVYLADMIIDLSYHSLEITTVPHIRSSRTVIAKDGDIELSNGVILTADGRLIRKGQELRDYKDLPRLPPLVQRIIRYLYEIRDHENNGRTLGELAEALSRTGNKRSILNAIRTIRKECKLNRISMVIAKQSEKGLANQFYLIPMNK